MSGSPASSHLLEGKRGVGGTGVGGAVSVAPLTAVSPSSVVSSAKSAGDRERGGGGQVWRRNDLTGSGPDSLPSATSCGSGRSGAVPFAQGMTPPKTGGYVPELEASGPPPFQKSVMDIPRLRQQLVDYTDSLFAEGLLDDQFTQLQLLQDANNPDFVAEVVTLFFDDSEKLLDQLAESLVGDPIDYKKVDSHVHQFKGSSSSIGAHRVKTACVTFRACCEDENRDGCRQALLQVKQEFNLVKAKLKAMFELEEQLLAAGGSLPSME